ncbi:M20 metallopeptidase family protein [Symbiobacterium thermophilum]|uniref:Amidohydrolase n=1 Tax=Symbiobacterium thermophilum TaxID=2734 RepID=A0A953I8A6_SYMTR|nr:M20 family metallopeptidase [Symbiobacterium thermophilum]MBY6275834.1 amidohydrolase [Symbiobacterium thermophilum]
MLSREQVWALARSVEEYGIAVRRRLHRNPELSFAEHDTHQYLAEELQGLGCSFRSHLAGGTGLHVVLGGTRPGPVVALRADIDALPIQEETGLPFASERPGVMHACGHDVHTAILLATARALKSVEQDLPGTVVLLFQPGEEKNPGGASLMIRDGVLDQPKVDAIFGLHVDPYLEAGRMAFASGPVMAAPDELRVTVTGRGGHGAWPHQTVDPIVTAAQIITLLQQVVARNVDPFQPAVLTVGMIHGGTAHNIIPDEVEFVGTVRTMDEGLRRRMPERIEAVIRGVCEAAGASYRMEYERGYPVLVNHPEATETGRRAAAAVLGEDRVGRMEPSMGGEDFAYYLERVPGTFARLGARSPGDAAPHGLHTSRLMIDESCIAVGVAYYIQVVQQFLMGER